MFCRLGHLDLLGPGEQDSSKGDSLVPWEDGGPCPEMGMDGNEGAGWPRGHVPLGLELPLYFCKEKGSKYPQPFAVVCRKGKASCQVPGSLKQA